jgi:hypothetical protein
MSNQELLSDDESSRQSYETAPDEQGDGLRRGPYVRISDEQYSLVVNALERGERPADIARWLQLNKNTVYSIQRRYETTGQRNRRPRGGTRGAKLGRGTD